MLERDGCAPTRVVPCSTVPVPCSEFPVDRAALRRHDPLRAHPRAPGNAMHPGQGCQLGGRFSRCERPAAHSCQYCGRAFCELHTYHAEAHDEVCLRKRCAAKHEDLVAHMGYTKRVAERNQVGLCGIEECGPHPGFECSLCHGHFCALHLSERMYPYTEGWVTIDRPVSICLSCWERRKIWRRR